MIGKSKKNTTSLFSLIKTFFEKGGTVYLFKTKLERINNVIII